MDIVGNLVLKGLGQIKNLRVENVVTDPVTPSAGAVWYNQTDGVYRGFDGTTVVTFASGGNTAVLLAQIQQIQQSVGLNTDDTLPSLGSTNYMTASTTLFGALVALDGQTKTNADAIAAAATASTALTTKVAAIITSEGLNADGTSKGYAGANYISAATDGQAADVALDAQAKIASDAIAANALAITTKVSKAGDAMTGNLSFGGTFGPIGVVAPTTADGAANKGYVDNLINGLTWLPPVDAIDAIDPSSGPAGQAQGYRVLNTTDGKIYTMGATAFDAGVSAPAGSAVMVKSDESGWTTNGTSWVQFTGAGQITAGVGLTKNGNIIDIQLGAGIGQLPTDEVGVDVLAAGGLFLTVDGTAPSTDGAAQLSVLLDGTTLSRSITGLKIGAAGVTAVELAASVAGAGLTGGAGTALSVVAGIGVAIDAGAVTLDLTYADARYLNTAGDTLTGPLLTAAAPAVPLEVANKGYVDTVSAHLTASSYLYTAPAAALTHTVAHGLGSQFVSVTVVDSSNMLIIPDSVSFDSTSQLTVGFTSAITCKVFVNGLYVGA